MIKWGGRGAHEVHVGLLQNTRSPRFPRWIGSSHSILHSCVLFFFFQNKFMVVVRSIILNTYLPAMCTLLFQIIIENSLTFLFIFVKIQCHTLSPGLLSEKNPFFFVGQIKILVRLFIPHDQSTAKDLHGMGFSTIIINHISHAQINRWMKTLKNIFI